MEMSQNTQMLVEKWSPILDHEDIGKIQDPVKRRHTAIVLENQERAMKEERMALNEAGPGNQTGAYPDAGAGIAKYDPVLISLVRRSLPNLIAYDVCGVQPMQQPTGLVFAMRTRYSNQSGQEAFYNEANSAFSGTGTQTGTDPFTATAGTGMDTASAEQLGAAGSTGTPAVFGNMGFTIEKVQVNAKSRALAADYSLELAQDLKALHGLDAESELTNILSTEILAELNREIIRTIYSTARVGCVAGSTAVTGTFDLDVDSNGRWSEERFKGLLFQLEREANVVAQLTRRGKANFIICSSDVASALAMTGKLSYTPEINNKLTVDDTGATYAGTLHNGMKVYIDPYMANSNAADQFAVLGYKGSNIYDAGLYYAPYVPLQMVRAVDPNTFAPRIGFKTRYGLVANPFAEGTTQGLGRIQANSNNYFRKIKIVNLM